MILLADRKALTRPPILTLLGPMDRASQSYPQQQTSSPA